MNISFSCLGIAAAAALMAALLQKESPAFALLLSVGASLVLLARVQSALATITAGLVRLEAKAGGEAYGCLLRCTGILLLTDYARTLCEEAGADALAWCTALAGRVLILAAAWPLLEEIGQKIGSLAG